MKKLLFKKLDAFTDGHSSGNPAGYILMEANELLNNVEMQKIARELKGFVSETGFVYQAENEVRLRYFSSECEVAFCGHATIAIMYDWLSHLPSPEDEINIRVNAGVLPVLNRIASENAVYITAPKPVFIKSDINSKQIADALSISANEINPDLPIRIIDGGLKTIIVPLRTLKGCLQTVPDQQTLRLFCQNNHIDIVHVSVKETYLSTCQFRTRVFAPVFGYLEDPATGSGNAAFGYYLLDEGLWPGDMTLEQGPSHKNPNLIKLKHNQKMDDPRILFGGSAITRIDGFYSLYPA